MNRSFEGGRPSRHHRRPVRFITYLLGNTLLDGSKRFPPNIQNKLGCRLPNPFITRLPNNATWPMKYEERDGSLWFSTGFGRFCRDLSIQPRTFLVWEFNYTNVLNVKVLQEGLYEGMNIVHPRHNVVGDIGSPILLTEFVVPVKPRFFSSNKVDIPRNEMEDYITPVKNQKIKVEIERTKATLTLLNYPKFNQCYLSKGWKELAADNNIVASDVMNFKLLITAEGLVLQLTVTKAR